MSRKRKLKRELLGKYLLVVEGETENLYFNGLKSLLPREYQRNINIRIENAQTGNALKIVNSAVKLKDKLEYPEVYVIFDYDNAQKLLQAISLAKRNGIKIILSKICFEFWLLLHFEYTSQEFKSCKQLINEKIRKYIKNYQKASELEFFLKKERILTAIRNAEKLRKSLSKNFPGKKFWNLPVYTNIDLLLKSAFKPLT